MRFVRAALAIILSGFVTSATAATMRISDDVGGRIGTYVNAYDSVRDSGDRVMIDGACLSACTLVLGIVPRERICVTRRATLGFHAAWLPGPSGRPIHSEAGTQALWAAYPQHVRRWINARGGLSAKMLFLRGRELIAMYPECHEADTARAEHGPTHERSRRSAIARTDRARASFNRN